MAVKKAESENKNFTCVTCGRSLETSRNFYRTLNPKYKTFGFLPTCKECMVDEFKYYFRETNDVRISIIATAMLNGIPFNDSNIPNFLKDNIKIMDDAVDLFYGFMKATNSIGKKILTTDKFDYITWITDAVNVKKDDKDAPIYSENDLGLEIDDEVINFFGSGFSYREYQILLSDYIDLIRNFDSDDYTIVQSFKDIAYINLKIAQAKSNKADQKEILNLFKARNEMFKLAGIDSKKSDSTEQLFYGNLVKRLESTRPATVKDEWNDNQFEELSNIVAGHLMTMEGKVGSARDKYDEIVKPFTVDVMSDEDDGDGE